MILDSSAVIAVLFREPAFEPLLAKMLDATHAGIGAPTLVECGIVLSARLDQDGRGRLARFLEELEITIIPFTERHYGTAVSAWLRYGKGRHPAALNFGDCLSYATAKTAGLPLLAIGDDFPLTDIDLA